MFAFFEILGPGKNRLFHGSQRANDRRVNVDVRFDFVSKQIAVQTEFQGSALTAGNQFDDGLSVAPGIIRRIRFRYGVERFARRVDRYADQRELEFRIRDLLYRGNHARRLFFFLRFARPERQVRFAEIGSVGQNRAPVPFFVDERRNNRRANAVSKNFRAGPVKLESNFDAAAF